MFSCSKNLVHCQALSKLICETFGEENGDRGPLGTQLMLVRRVLVKENISYGEFTHSKFRILLLCILSLLCAYGVSLYFAAFIH